MTQHRWIILQSQTVKRRGRIHAPLLLLSLKTSQDTNGEVTARGLVRYLRGRSLDVIYKASILTLVKCLSTLKLPFGIRRYLPPPPHTHSYDTQNNDEICRTYLYVSAD